MYICIYVYTYTYKYICTHIYIHIHIYIYIERERDLIYLRSGGRAAGGRPGPRRSRPEPDGC